MQATLVCMEVSILVQYSVLNTLKQPQWKNICSLVGLWGGGKRTLKSLEILKYGFKLIFQKHFTKHSGAVAFHPERFELV